MPRISQYLSARWLYSRSLYTSALLAAYLTSAVGIPLPSGARRHSSEEYPCAASACGCATAEQCWRSCCCHSLAERFEWAREHRVRPPEYAIAAAQQAGIDLAWLGLPPVAKKAELAAKPPCDDHVAASDCPACCQAHSTCCQREDRACCAHEPNQPQKPTSADRIVAWRALACHGQSLNWLAATPTHIVPRPALSHDLPLVAWLGPATSEAACRVASSPDVPPPERA